jgi:hypothetical protein
MSGTPKRSPVRLSRAREAALAAERAARRRRRRAEADTRAARRAEQRTAREAERAERIRRAAETAPERERKQWEHEGERAARDERRRTDAVSRRDSARRPAVAARPARGTRTAASRPAPDWTRSRAEALHAAEPIEAAHAQAEALLAAAAAAGCIGLAAIRTLQQADDALSASLASGRYRDARLRAEHVVNRLGPAEAEFDEWEAARQRRRAVIASVARHLPEHLVATAYQENPSGEIALHATGPSTSLRITVGSGPGGQDELRYELPDAARASQPGLCPEESAMLLQLHARLAADGVQTGALTWPDMGQSTETATHETPRSRNSAR